MKFLKFIFLFSICLKVGYGEKLNLDTLLDHLRETHPFMQAEDLSVDIEDREKKAIAGGEDWMLESQPKFVYQEPVSSSSFTSKEVKNTTADINLSRAWWKTGGQVAFKWGYDYLDQKSNFFFTDATGNTYSPTLNRFHQHGVFLSYLQPLLKNRAGKQDRLRLDLQEYTIEISQLQTMENKEDFLLQIAQYFIDWVSLDRLVKITKDREVLAEKQLKRTSDQRKSNLVDEVDLLRAENDLRVARQRTLLVASNRDAVQARLAAISGMQHFETFRPDYDLEAHEVPPEEAIHQIVERSRLIKIIELDMASLQRTIKSYKDLKRPTLNLELGGGLQGGDRYYDDSWALDHTDLRVGFNLQYPLGNHSAEAELEKVRLELEQANKRLLDLQRKLEGSLRNTWIQIKELSKILTLNEQQIVSSVRKTKAEEKMYEQGRSSLNFVINSRDDEGEARSRLVENAASYHKLKLEWKALEDRLLP